jgi:tripartite-type tricarboxylate transporter receptor subunit TctC
MKRLASLLAAALCVVAAHAANAQEKIFTKPIKIVVAFGPGSATDVTARILADHMRPLVGQSVIVENKPGAFGIIAIEEMARAKPDGHTVMIGNVSTSALTPQLYRKRFSIDPEKDIAPISRISVLPGFFLVSPKHTPAKTLAEFIAFAKERPGKVRYSTTGVGAFTHFEGEMLQRRAGIKMVHIPVKEGPPGMVRDILSGDIHVASMTMSTAAGLVASGQLRPLTVSTEKRVPEYPDVPTMDESGFPGLFTSNWSMMFVPAATPRPVQEALHAAVVKALNSPELKAAYQKTLTYATPSASVDEARAWVTEETARWKRIIDEVKLDIEQ